jgi:predicted GNAT superfamily acetyltransferase
LPTDRFQVDWWTNSSRVKQRLSKNARRKLDLAHFLSIGAEIINPTFQNHEGLPQAEFNQKKEMTIESQYSKVNPTIILIEIPSDFLELKSKNISLARDWRILTRTLFEYYFDQNYLITDFVHMPGENARSFYVLSFGNSTL